MEAVLGQANWPQIFADQTAPTKHLGRSRLPTLEVMHLRAGPSTQFSKSPPKPYTLNPQP